MADVTKYQPTARLKLTVNGVTIYQRSFAPSELDYTESTADRVVLAAAMGAPQQYNMGGITTGKCIFIKTSIPIQVSFNGSTDLVPLGVDANEGGLLLMGEFTSVYLYNTNPTETATVDIAIAGE